jgi:hypothetical protein
VHGKDRTDQEVIGDVRAGQSVEAPSAVRSTSGGRHRAAEPAGDIPTGRPRRGRLRTGLASTPVRLALVAAVTGGLAFVAASESKSATDRQDALDDAMAARVAAAAERPASRYTREAIEPTATATPTPTPVATTAAPRPKVTKPPKPAKPARPRPVAGLTQAQMDNANTIVKVGRGLKVPRKGIVVAIATAMQESNLYNLANGGVPESLNYPNQGTGYDNDSVGLFQQRPSSGWGSVADLMKPAYAARQFFVALLQVPGWQQLSVTVAAQTVQVSAFPDAYAQHEENANTVVDALI